MGANVTTNSQTKVCLAYGSTHGDFLTANLSQIVADGTTEQQAI